MSVKDTFYIVGNPISSEKNNNTILEFKNKNVHLKINNDWWLDTLLMLCTIELIYLNCPSLLWSDYRKHLNNNIGKLKMIELGAIKKGS